MSRKQGVGQIIKASVTVVTRIALTGGFRVIKATLDDLYRLTRGARHAVGPAQLADRLITLHIIDEMLNVDLHGWTPVRDRGMRCRQFTPSAHATTLESNKSIGRKRRGSSWASPPVSVRRWASVPLATTCMLAESKNVPGGSANVSGSVAAVYPRLTCCTGTSPKAVAGS